LGVAAVRYDGAGLHRLTSTLANGQTRLESQATQKVDAQMGALKYPIVWIQWIDAATVNGWNRKESAVLQVCESVGFLLEEDKHSVKIAQNCSEGELYAEITVIPKAGIAKRLILESAQRGLKVRKAKR
jgi:hypothetical protein